MAGDHGPVGAEHAVHGTDRSDLVVLDTAALAGAPTAVIHLPWRVPCGFHGDWLPDGSA